MNRNGDTDNITCRILFLSGAGYRAISNKRGGKVIELTVHCRRRVDTGRRSIYRFFAPRDFVSHA